MERQHLFLARIDDIQRKLREANYECNQLRELIQQDSLQRPPAVVPPLAQPKVNPVAPPKVQSQNVPPVIPPASIPVDPPKVEVPKVEIPKVVEPPKVEQQPSPKPLAPPVMERTHVAVSTPNHQQSSGPAPQAPKAPFSLEGFIGGNLLNKIGIGILILGIGLFVKYAIDKDWIGPLGRVMIGILSGLVLLGFAHGLRKKYKAFSSVLVGGGMTVLYLTFAIAYHVFEMFPHPVAFGIMCGLTLFTVGFSLLYDRKEIAVMALLGGFATPFIVFNGEGHASGLFTYYVILNTGMILLAWFRRWPLINVMSYIVSVLAFGAWHLTLYVDGKPEAHELLTSFGFSVAFFVQFFLMNIAHQIRFRERFKAQDYLMLLSNTFVMFALGITSLAQIQDGKWMGLFTVSMAVIHFTSIVLLRKRFAHDTHFIHLLLGLVLTFVTLAIPIQLKGHVITLFWAAEGVLVLYMARRTRITLLEVGGYVVTALSVLGFVWDISKLYAIDRPEMLFLFNRGVMTTLFVSGALMSTWFLQRKKDVSGNAFFWYASLAILYIGLMSEVTLQAGRMMYFDNAAIVVGYLFTAGYAAAMSVLAHVKRDKMMGILMLVAGWAIPAAYMLTVIPALEGYADRPEIYNLHFWSIPTVGLLLVINMLGMHKWVSLREVGGVFAIWASVVAYLLFASSELTLALTGWGMDTLAALKAGLTILWGVSAAFMIVWGMNRKLLHLRIAALGLFGITILKLFVLDIRGMETGGKIAAFILLGVLLLAISFLYQRLKFLVVDETRSQTNNEKTADQ